MRFDLGILGGGQLARMTIHAAQRLGLRCITLDPGEATPASELAPNIVGDLDDPFAIAALADQCARLTLENEFIPASALWDALTYDQFAVITPSIDALATIQDKLVQRQALARAGVPSPRAVAIDGDGQGAIEAIGFPMVLKARFGGYDGKGTRYAKTRDEFEAHRRLWSQGGWLAEEFVPFRRELAVMVCIDAQTESAFPTMETVQKHHVCDLVFPADADGRPVARAAIRALKSWGLFGVELFELESGEILVNEIAPRPHNTGHYTLDWGGTSQFEQHVRVATGLPIDPAPSGQATCMANILGIDDAGDHRPALAAMLEVEPQAHLHWYGKAESRPGRKMGHVNVVGADCVERAVRARDAFLTAWRA